MHSNAAVTAVVLSVLASCCAIPIQNDSADQHDTENDHLIVGTEAQQIHAVGEDGDEHDAQNDADDRALPAAQRAAADHRGGNGSKRKFRVQQGLARRQRAVSRKPVIAARTAQQRYVTNRTCGTEMPAISAALGLEPVA